MVFKTTEHEAKTFRLQHSQYCSAGAHTATSTTAVGLTATAPYATTPTAIIITATKSTKTAAKALKATDPITIALRSSMNHRNSRAGTGANFRDNMPISKSQKVVFFRPFNFVAMSISQRIQVENKQ